MVWWSIQRGHATTGNKNYSTRYEYACTSRTISKPLLLAVLFLQSSKRSREELEKKKKKKTPSFEIKVRCVYISRKGSARSIVSQCVSVTTILRNVSLIRRMSKKTQTSKYIVILLRLPGANNIGDYDNNNSDIYVVHIRLTHGVRYK